MVELSVFRGIKGFIENRPCSKRTPKKTYHKKHPLVMPTGSNGSVVPCLDPVWAAPFSVRGMTSTAAVIRSQRNELPKGEESLRLLWVAHQQNWENINEKNKHI